MVPPLLLRPRGMVEHAFTRERAEEMRPSIQGRADSLVDGMVSHGPGLDLVECFALPLPSEVRTSLEGGHASCGVAWGPTIQLPLPICVGEGRAL